MKLSIVEPLNPQVFEYVKLKTEIKGCSAFRFFTIVMYGIPLDNLAPQYNIVEYLNTLPEGDECTRDFDIAYANQLMNNPYSFIDLMQIMSSLQLSDEVFLLSNYSHPYVAQILDSLIKFIQERYSIYPYIINEYEDINDLAISDFQTIDGYKNFNADLDRFNMLYTTKEQIEECY